MSTEGLVPTKAELQAYALGKLAPSRAVEVGAYADEHPECLAELESAPDDELVRHLRGAKEGPARPRRPSLLELAVEAVLPVVAGCAGALAVGGVEGGLVGAVAGQAAEKAINVFGRRIVTKWLEWLRHQPPGAQTAAVAELAGVPAEVGRSQVAAALAGQVPQASEADRRAAAEYLAAIPQAVRQSLLSDRRTLMPSVSVDDAHSLLRLLPANLPPYVAPRTLPGTAYRLEELVGTGGFGAVYRATLPNEQYLHRAIKFCLDPVMVPVLRRERENLERLIEVGGGRAWSPRIVRLYGYDLEHATPYLVYEYVAGGDLVSWLERRQAKEGRGLTPGEVLAIITQVVEGLAFAHERGIVHRDLKPANVLIEDEAGKVKLADFGIGGAVAEASRVGVTAAAVVACPAEQASLFRGAGTPLYVDPDQKEGKEPDPRHDLFSLGVAWYQLLVGDVRREMRHGWEDELLEERGVPAEHVHVIKQCVGLLRRRPRDGGVLLQELRSLAAPRPPQALPAAPPPMREPRASATSKSGERFRAIAFAVRMKQLHERHEAVAKRKRIAWPIVQGFFLGALGMVLGLLVGVALWDPARELWRVWVGGKFISDDSWIASTGIVLSLASICFRWYLWLRKRRRARLELTARIKETFDEFPDECQACGGQTALQDEELVRHIVQELEESLADKVSTRPSRRSR